MIPDDFYKQHKDVILLAMSKIYPPIKKYYLPVRWEDTDDGSIPIFEAPDDILQGLHDALYSER
jgi:hypothetical protein